MQKQPKYSVESIFLWGTSFLVFTLVLGLVSYYAYSSAVRYLTLAFMLMSLCILFYAMAKDMLESKQKLILTLFLLFGLLTIYFLQRMEFHRFDFSVGDASDYFLAGICSVTYSQDIGYILPLSATLSAIGYDIFGIEYLPLIYVIFYASSIPMGYLIFRKLQLSSLASFLMSVFFVFTPLSIWYAKSSFSEPLWQILLLIFIVHAHNILQTKYLSWQNILTLYLLLFLVPLLRVEGVLYYGLILFVAMYHFWKFTNFKASLILGLGTLIVASSTHISLKLRADYLLDRQFNRIIPNATEYDVMFALYGLAIVIFMLLGIMYVLRNNYKKMNFPLILAALTIPIKLGIAYAYALKKDMPFMDMLFFNEYAIAVGSFGIPLTLFIFFGLILLYIYAAKGKTFALILIVVYTLFYIPYVMQAVRFTDPHAFFFYWNRYYFSVFMMIHLFALAVSLRYIYKQLHARMKNIPYSKILLGLSILLLCSSINPKLYTIVVKESHLKGSYKFYDWVKNKVGTNPIALVLDSSMMYEQNARPDGREDIKYFVDRTFSIYKISVKHRLKVSPKALYAPLSYQISSHAINYVLCLGEKECLLTNPQMTKVDTFTLPLEWREHFGLSPEAETLHHNDITQSIIKKYTLTATLYKVQKTFSIGKEIVFKPTSSLSNKILSKGWIYASNSIGAYSTSEHAKITLPPIKKKANSNVNVLIKYALKNATISSPQSLHISLATHSLKIVSTAKSTMQTLIVNIPASLLDEYKNNLTLDIIISEKTLQMNTSKSLYIKSLTIIQS